jgi:hypothetical protein
VSGVNPIDHEDLYDKIELARVRSPGKVTLSGHELAQHWDVKEGVGQNDAKLTRKGKKAQAFSASFYLVKDETEGIDEYAEWDDYLPLLMSFQGEGKTAKAGDVYHPDLAELGITSVVVDTIGGKVHDGKGGATVVVKFIGYKIPKPAGGSPKGAWHNAKNKVPDPNARAKKELEDLLKQAEKA